MSAISTRTATPTFIAAFCLLATVAGCQSRTSTEGEGMSQGPSNSLEQRVSTSSSTLGQGLTTVTLNDDSMNNMPATEISVPTGWHVQGRMTMVPCASIPSPTWDASSPDGNSQINVLPTFGWKWGMRSSERKWLHTAQRTCPRRGFSAGSPRVCAAYGWWAPCLSQAPSCSVR